MEFTAWDGRTKHLPSEELPFENPIIYLESLYDSEVASFSTLQTRKEVIDCYKRNKKILNDMDLWASLRGSKYDFGNGKSFELGVFQFYLLTTLKNECHKRLLITDEFDPYKESAYSKIQAIRNYDPMDQIVSDVSWDFYYPARPSIAHTINTLINMKIDDRAEIIYSDYYFLFKQIGLTNFGYDHFRDVTEEFNNILDIKQKSTGSLLLKYHQKFNRSNSRYRTRWARLHARVSQPTPCDYPRHTCEQMFRCALDAFQMDVEDFANSTNRLWKDEPNPDPPSSAFPGVAFENIVSLNSELVKYFRLAENVVRENINLPRINEGWISETQLFNQIQTHFKGYKVIHHASPKFLGRQHYDIFLPSQRIAIEYQGKQHYEPVEFFGGREAFDKNVERDKRKAELSKLNGVELIYVDEGYDLADVVFAVKQGLQNIIP